MKLIIDVPDEVLKSRHYCRYFGAWSTKLTETIENGIPYEERPLGDLISRDALKQALSEPLYRSTIKDFGEVIEYTHIMNTIDNAPTVDLTKNQAYDKGFITAMKLYSRPQGEWILNKDENPECPFCHHSFTYWGNFCGNCGADMQNGEEK